MLEKAASSTFRSVFKIVDKEALQWFPGHMNKGLKQMQHKLKNVDCIIEVHDCRIPISGRNPDFKYTLGGIKPHILVLNKIDLINKSYIPRIKNALVNENENVIFTNCKSQKCRGVSELLPLAENLIQKSNRFNRTGLEDFNIMIIGVPNVGKSSLINALRVRNSNRGKAAPVGAVPGITRSVMTKIKISDKPLFYILDTPGILTPKVNDPETGLKLALCATLQDHLVGPTTMADYLLYLLNKYKCYQYVKYFELNAPVDNILEVLTHISFTRQKMLKIRNSNNEYELRPDFNNAALFMLKCFRTGELGPIMLDKDLIDR